jgi:hypothetical protein
VRNFSEEFKLNICGIDCLVSEDDGSVYVIDCNYWPSYSGLGKAEVAERFDNLVKSH